MAQGSNTSNGILVSGLTILFVFQHGDRTHHQDQSICLVSFVVALCFAAVLAGVIWAWIES